MALARVQYESDGSTTVYSIPFPYINRDDIKVSIDGTETQDFVFLDGSTIDLASPAPLGEIVDVVRETERTDLLVEFNDGSTLLESDLTLAALQSFYIAQEAFDQTGSTLAVADDGSYSASDRRISLLGYPTKQEDAANKQYVDDVFAQGEDAFEQAQLAADSADTAVGARDAVQAAESTTLNYRNTAEQHKIDAAASASAASTSETNAADSATAAQASEDDVAANAQAAQDAEDLALAHRDDAQTAAGQSQTSAQDANDSEVSASNDAAAASNSASNAATSETNAQTYRDQAQGSATAAATSETNASTSEQNASDSEAAAASSETAAAGHADDAEAWAAGVNMPSAAGNGGRLIRQAADESGFEYITASEGRTLLDVYSTGDVYTKSESDGKYAQLSGGPNANFSNAPQLGGVPLYEEGSWTPSTTNSGGFLGNGFDSVENAEYIRIGNWVTLYFSLNFTEADSTAHGAMDLTIPFDLKRTSTVSGSVGIYDNVGGAGFAIGHVQGITAGDKVYIFLYRNFSGDGNPIRGHVSYFTADS